MTGVATDTGLAGVVSALVAANTPFLGWGGGAGQGETATDLASAFAESRASGTGTVATTNTTGDTYRVTGSIAATADRSVTEVGVFSDASGAVLQYYGDFPALTVASGESVSFTIDVVIDQVA